MENFSLSDIAAVTGSEGLGGNGFFWIFALLILLGMGNGGLFGGNNYGQYATAASQQDILFSSKFESLGSKVDKVGDGIASLGYSLQGMINSEGRSIQTQFAETNANLSAQIQSIKDMISADKIATLQNQVNNLTMQNAINTATAGVVKYPMATTYCSGSNPYCGCNNY